MDTKKQIYAQAFCIYALCEYYAICENADALNWAIEIFELIEEHSYDHEYPGYFEALDRNWNPLVDVRLSEKEPNVNKTMNTHVHIFESYIKFLKVWGSGKLKKQLKQLINIILGKIIDSKTGHFNLFFDDRWNLKPSLFSYGHDIEGSWLLSEAAELLGDKVVTESVKKASLRLANITLEEGTDKDGGIMNDGDINGVIDTDKHWWPQAEAMVGFLNAFQISGDRKFFDASYNCWKFVKRFVVDPENGEWFFRVTREGKPYYAEEYKLGPWKAPYHNTRACLELLERLQRLKN
jgi:mannobiose 2-epimerase